MRKPPLSVLAIALLYIAVGVIGFVFHFRDLHVPSGFQYDGVLIEVTELCAAICGVFMLRRQNWARWLALAWMVFHVILSVFDQFRGFVVHCVILALVAWAVFRPEASRFFSGRRLGETGS